MRLLRRVPVLMCLAFNRRSLEHNDRSLKPTFPVVYFFYPTSESTAYLFSLYATLRSHIEFFRIIVVGSSDRTEVPSTNSMFSSSPFLAVTELKLRRLGTSPWCLTNYLYTGLPHRRMIYILTWYIVADSLTDVRWWNKMFKMKL